MSAAVEIPATGRSAERPMAFTPGEFFRGLAWAMLLVPIGIGVAMNIGSSGTTSDGVETIVWLVVFMPFFAWAYGFFYLAPAFVVGGILAYLLGRALIRCRFLTLHFAAFTLLGGIIASLTYRLTNGMAFVQESASGGIICGLAVGVSWWLTAVFALRRDRRRAYGHDVTTDVAASE